MQNESIRYGQILSTPAAGVAQGYNDAPRAREISELTERLQRHIVENSSLIEALESRLGGLTRAEPPTPQSTEQKLRSACATGYGEVLRGMCEPLAATNERIQSLLQRLEI